MGLTSKSKFTFPLPGRRQKQAQPSPPPPPPSGTLSKAQKVLGTSHISVDLPSTLSPGSKWGWDSRSNSGISIAVSETAASHHDDGEMGLGIVHEGEVANPSARRELRWEDESEIIPKTFTRQSTMAMGDATDASSLRRRQSSSTIASFYDKSKLPLSISQQTSNSAMAKGVPAKVHAMLDMDGANSNHKDNLRKKKPSRLDLSSLLPKSMSQRHLRPDVDKSHVLGPDMMTKSPSIMSISPGMTPPPTKQGVERFLRRKKTKESLKDVRSPSEPRQQYQQPGRPTSSPNPNSNSHRPTKSTVQLHNLYDHYEQRLFAEAMEQSAGGGESPLKGHHGIAAYPTPQDSSPFVPPLRPRMSNSTSAKQQQSPDMCLSAAVLSPLSLTSVPADTASISSRHTRTSKASKRTDRSLTDLDLRQNSVLSLSSDSEEDGYEPSYNSSLAVPPLSDGQASPTSPRSAMSQRSGASSLQDPGRPKPQKRTSFASSPQFLPIPEGSSPSHPPRINTRLSSLNPNSTPKPAPNGSRPDPRMSIASTSTSKTLMFGVAARDHPQGPKIISMMRRNSPPYQPAWPPSSDSNGFDFPTPPGYSAHRPSIASATSDHPTPPVSPTSVDFYLQSQHTSLAALDDESIRSGKSFGSATKVGGPRRGSATSSLNDTGTNTGRFMAVTKQEEMLLAALRIKRARMREDIIAEFEEDTDRDEHNLDRHITNDSSASSSRISRQSSASTMRTYETGTLTMRPQHPQQPQIRISTGSTEKRAEANHPALGGSKAPLMLDDATENGESKMLEPIPDLTDFIDFDNFDTESLALPMQRHSIRVEVAERDRGIGNSRSRSSSNSGPRAPTGLGTRTSTSSLSAHRGIRNDIPSQIPEEDSLDEDDEDVPRPDSPISPISPTSFPVPMALTRKKQVRLSAVGNHQVNVEAGWWNDSG